MARGNKRGRNPQQSKRERALAHTPMTRVNQRHILALHRANQKAGQ